MADIDLLVIEDDSTCVNFISLCLDSYGYKVYWAPDVQKARDILRSRKIAAILCDQNLDQESGLDFIGELRNQREGDKLPVLMLTGDTDHTIVQRAARLGVGDFVVKPFSARRLRKAVAKVIASSAGTTTRVKSR